MFYSLRNFTSNANAVKGEKLKNISKEIKKTKNKNKIKLIADA